MPRLEVNPFEFDSRMTEWNLKVNKITKEALQNAVSIAGTAMTMGALVVDVPQPEKAGGPDMSGAMGGMM